MGQSAARKEKVLLLGATGFIGKRVLDLLLERGYDVICGVRSPAACTRCSAIAVDFNRDTSEDVWLPRLSGIDVVVNAVGIIRETRDSSFDALHVATPKALFSAALHAAVRKVVQISALGADDHAVSRYHRSKKAADDALAALPVPWCIVQPSLVFGEGGASARLFTRLAALPFIAVPGDGSQRVQPIHIDDVAEVIVYAVEKSACDHCRVAAVGPAPLSFREFLTTLRALMGLTPAPVLRVPLSMVRIAAAVGERVPGALLDRETLDMLLRGNVASAHEVTAFLRKAPRPVSAFLDRTAARALANEARLAWLLALMRAAVGLTWIVTGIVSLGLYPVEESYALLARVGLTGLAASIALYGAALLDLGLGIGVFVLRQRRSLWRAQMLLIVAYTTLITLFLPEYWLHPYGPVLKNLPLLAAILMLHEFEPSRAGRVRRSA